MPEIPLQRTPSIPVKKLTPAHTISAAATSVVLFVGRTPVAIADKYAPVQVNSFTAFQEQFGGLNPAFPLTYALWLFFLNGGHQALVLSTGTDTASPSPDPRITALADLRTPFNILVVLPDQLNGDLSAEVMNAALAACVEQNAMFILDAPAAWSVRASKGDFSFTTEELTLTPASSFSNCALYFPRLELADPLNQQVTITLGTAAPVAAVWTQSDTNHGIWKSPSNIALSGISALTANISDAQQSTLNLLVINAIRTFPGKGTLVWGARTLSADPQYQYISVRRLQFLLESSLQAGLQWATLETNNELLWSAVTSAANAFLTGLFHAGAFVGATTSDAFFIRCDNSTTTAEDIANGKLNLAVGFAPLRPSEFIVLSIQLHVLNPKKRSAP
jgi:phage tail sheath protein FI